MFQFWCMFGSPSALFLRGLGFGRCRRSNWIFDAFRIIGNFINMLCIKETPQLPHNSNPTSTSNTNLLAPNTNPSAPNTQPSRLPPTMWQWNVPRHPHHYIWHLTTSSIWVTFTLTPIDFTKTIGHHCDTNLLTRPSQLQPIYSLLPTNYQ